MRLIATVTADSASAGGTAWIQIGTGDIITVKVGDELDGAKVVDIQNKQMTLETAGQQTTLKLQQHLWLSPEQ